MATPQLYDWDDVPTVVDAAPLTMSELVDQAFLEIEPTQPFARLLAADEEDPDFEITLTEDETL